MHPPQAGPRSTNRLWLSAFLRSRRERLSPTDYGFPVMKRRRAPGLLREEVAQLAGISVAYYTWLEQGREIHVSADVLNAIARALRLTEAERVHLFTLIEDRAAETPAEDDAVHPTIASIVRSHSDLLALLYDPWFNVLTATTLVGAVFDLLPGRGTNSNILYRLFCDPAHRALIADWETEAHMGVGMFRHALAKHSNCKQGALFLETMLQIADFKRIWDAYDVRVLPSPDEFFSKPLSVNHPSAGALRLRRVAAWIPGPAEKMLCLLSPDDEETAKNLGALSCRQVVSGLHDSA